MISIFVEIHSFEQIRRLETSFIEEVSDHLLNIFKKRGHYLGSGLFEFSSGIAEKQLIILAEQILLLRDYLFSIREKLIGYTVIIDATKDLDGLKNTLFRIPDTIAFRVLKRAGDLLGPYLELEDIGEYLILKGKRQSAPIARMNLDSFFARQEITELILSKLTPLVNGEEENTYFFLHGAAFTGKRKNLILAMDRFSNAEFPVLWFKPAKNDLLPYGVLREGIESSIFPFIPEVMNPLEQKLWEERKTFPELRFSQNLEQDMYLGFRLYLSGYIRWMEKNLITPFLVLDDLDNWDTLSRGLILRLCDELMASTSFIPVVISKNSIPPSEFAHHTYSSLYVYPLSITELRNRFPELNTLKEIKKYKDISLGKILPLFHIQYVDDFELSDIHEPFDISKAAIKHLKPLEKRILAISALTRGGLSRSAISEFFSESGVDVESIDKAWENLDESGFLEGFEYPDLSISRLKPAVEKEGMLYMKEDTKAVTQWVYHRWLEGTPFPESTLIEMVAAYGTDEQREDLVFKIYEKAIQEGIKELPGLKELLDISGYRYKTLFLRHALLHNRMEKARETFAAIREGDFEKADPWQLAAAHYLYSTGHPSQALNRAKKVLLRNEKAPSLECNANLLIGLSMLGVQKIDEAREYFVIAREAAERSDVPGDYILSMVYEAITKILSGNLSRALRIIDTVLPFIVKHGRREWELLLVFLKGRICLSTGWYEQAKIHFMEGLSLTTLYGRHELKELHYRWLGLAVLHEGNTGEALKLLNYLSPGIERDLFLAEAWYVAGEPDKSLALLDRMVEGDLLEPVSLFPGEYVPMENGFSPVEDRLFRTSSGFGILWYLVRVFRIFYSGIVVDREAAIEELSRITRDEKVSEIDPNNSLYYYLLARLIPSDSGEAGIDRLTVLSKGLKYLQQQASQIDDPHQKKDFLMKARWNSLLFEEVKANNLI